MRCYSCSAFPGSTVVKCPGQQQEIDSGMSCTVRSLSDSTVVYQVFRTIRNNLQILRYLLLQGNVGTDIGCSGEMIQHYNYLTDKTFRLGNSRSACCDWDLCNESWETANMTLEQYQAFQQEQVAQSYSTIAAAVAGGVALVLWCILFVVLLIKKQKKGDKSKNNDAKTENADGEVAGYNNSNLYELQIPDSPGPIVKPKKNLTKQKPKSPKNRDFSVQANGLNNQSNQTDVFEDESIKNEIEILKGKIEALRNPSKIPRKNGSSNLFHQNDLQLRYPVESVGIQSLTHSSSSIQTSDMRDSSTETSKILVNTATDPMSTKKKQRPEFIVPNTSEGSTETLHSGFISPSPSQTSLESSNTSVRSPSAISMTDSAYSRQGSEPPPVVVSSPTPPLTDNKTNDKSVKFKKENEDKNLLSTSVSKKKTKQAQKEEVDSFDEQDDKVVEEVDDDSLTTVNVKQSSVYKNKEPKLKGSFKLCVDSVRMLPDFSLTFRISGKILNLPDKPETSFSVYSDDDWPHRSPRCTFEKVFNSEGKEVSKAAVLLLKLYAVDVNTKNVIYVGYTIFDLTDSKGEIRSGGHKLPVFYSSPKPSKGNINNLKEADADKKKLLPCASMCIRIIESNKSFKPRPAHKSGYYKVQSTSTKLEKKLFEHYFSIDEYNTTLKQWAKGKGLAVEEGWVKNLYEDKGEKPGTLDLRLFIKNEPKRGVKIQVVFAGGLPFSHD